MSPVRPYLTIEFRARSNTLTLQAQHKHFNSLLNELKLKSSQHTHPSSPLEYTHLHLIDTFYQGDNPREKEKIRVTRREKSGEVVACMQKIRLGSIDIYSPKRAADWRISVNMEIPGMSSGTIAKHSLRCIAFAFLVPPPIGSPTHTRKKDRMSYTHEEFIIDLTQVTSSSSGPNAKVRTTVIYSCRWSVICPFSRKFSTNLKLNWQGRITCCRLH